MFDVVLVLLVAGPFFMIRCLAGLDDAVDGLGVVELEIHAGQDWLLRAHQLIQESWGTSWTECSKFWHARLVVFNFLSLVTRIIH